MSGVHDAAGLLGGAVLALGCVPLLAREAASAVRAAAVQAVVLALVLAARGASGAAWGELAGALALAALGLGALPRLLRGSTALAPARAQGRWRRTAAGLGLVVLGAAAAHGAALLQQAAPRDMLCLALPTTLTGLLAASLRRAAAIRGAALASALHGVVLAALALPDGAGPAVFVAAPVLAMLAVAALSGGPAGEPGGGAAPAMPGAPVAGAAERADSRIGSGA